MSSAHEDVHRPDIRNEEWGGPVCQQCVHVCVIYTWSLMFGDLISTETARPLSRSSSLTGVRCGLHSGSQGRRRLHKCGGLAEVGVVREAVPQSRPFPNAAHTPADCSVNHLRRGKEIRRQCLFLTGAVPTSLYAVQDLLLQFFPLLLLLGQSLSYWL